MLSNFVASLQALYEKLEEQSLWSFCIRPKRLLVRHSASESETSRMLGRVIAATVDQHMPLHLSLSRNLWSCAPILLCTARAPSGTRREKRRNEHVKTVAESLDSLRYNGGSWLL